MHSAPAIGKDPFIASAKQNSFSCSIESKKCSNRLTFALNSKPLYWDKMVRSEGLEPPTPWFEAKYSIQLSYER